MQGDTGPCRETLGHAGRHWVMQGDTGSCRETLGHAGRHWVTHLALFLYKHTRTTCWE